MIEPAPASSALRGVLTRYRNAERRSAQVARKPGRPRKRTPEYLAELLAAYDSTFAWFRSQKGRAPRSDVELLTTYFGHLFTEAGERPSRAFSPSFLRSLKTLRNELGDARRFRRPHPENHPFSGTRAGVE